MIHFRWHSTPKLSGHHTLRAPLGKHCNSFCHGVITSRQISHNSSQPSTGRPVHACPMKFRFIPLPLLRDSSTQNGKHPRATLLNPFLLILTEKITLSHPFCAPEILTGKYMLNIGFSKRIVVNNIFFLPSHELADQEHPTNMFPNFPKKIVFLSPIFPNIFIVFFTIQSANLRMQSLQMYFRNNLIKKISD